MRLSSVASVAAPALALVCVLPAAAHADRRALTFSYEYMTAPEDQTEVELVTTQQRASWKDGSPETYELTVELEHGAGERWDVSLYQTFAQASSGPAATTALHLAEVRLGGRYRFADRGEWPVDLMVTGEVARQFGASAYLGAARVVVARDLDLLTITVNAIGSITFGDDVVDREEEVGWAGGATYELAPAWKLGAESWGAFDVRAPDEVKGWAGPAAAWIPTTRLWVAGTAGFGLTNRSDDFTARAIVGLVL